MRLIDADTLLQTLSDLGSGANNIKTRRIVDMVLHDLMPQIINDEPTIDAQPGWIKCGDKLPDIGVGVLLCEDDNYIDIGYLTYYNMFSIYDVCCDIDIDKIKAWMPLPEPPEVTP